MQLALDVIGDLIGILGIGVLIFYVPFAKTCERGFASVFFIFLLWGIVRFVATALFRDEPDAPGIAFFVIPFFYALLAVLIRGLSFLLFKIPGLAGFRFNPYRVGPNSK